MLEQKVGLITGIFGQDASYLAELLLDKGYKVIGTKRRTSTESPWRIQHLLNNKNLIIEYGDVTDFGNTLNLIEKYKPDEIYNLAAMSFVKTSFEQPNYTFQVNAIGPINILESIRLTQKLLNKQIKVYQANTSECFGNSYDVKIDQNGNKIKYQDEKTLMNPQSPYAVSKLAAFKSMQLYRHAYHIFACSGTLFNHSSYRRGEEFLIRKVTKYVGNVYKELQCLSLISLKIQDKTKLVINKIGYLELGNLDSYRDEGHSKDYMMAAWMMLQQNNADDYVICSGETHQIRDFVKLAFIKIGIDNYMDFVKINPIYFRPSEVDYLLGCADKATNILGWKPTISFDQLMDEMVRFDCHN